MLSELRYAWHLPPRHGTESVNTCSVVFDNCSNWSTEMFSNCRHTIQLPNAFQIPGSHGMLNYSIVLAPSQQWSGFCVHDDFSKYGEIPHHLCSGVALPTYIALPCSQQSLPVYCVVAGCSPSFIIWDRCSTPTLESALSVKKASQSQHDESKEHVSWKGSSLSMVILMTASLCSIINYAFGRTKNRSSINRFTPLFFDICCFFFRCRVKLPCACGSNTSITMSHKQEFRPDADQRPKK